MKTLWFRNKTYGWGWYPATWEGWVVLAVFIILLVLNTLTLTATPEPTATELTWFFVREAVLVALVLAVCYKTGEKPHWQWGKKK
jgi:hypothetical protein